MRLLQILIGILSVTICITVSASHIRSGEIVVKRIDCNSNLFEITLIGYVNTLSGVQFGGTGNNLAFGDGVAMEIPVLVPQAIDASVMVGRVEFKMIHAYPGPGNYTVTYREANRNEGILNIGSSITTPFSIETYLLIEPGICNSTPYLSVPPIDRACKGIMFYHNAGAVDPDDDSLSYELVTPLAGPGTLVSGYTLPADPKFYGSDYAQGNENNNGPPVLSIDSRDGTLTWDSPGAIGEYTVAIRISEWKLNPADTTWYKTGHTVRDMQIIVEDCMNQKPDLSVPESYCIIAGNTIQFTAKASDPDHDDVVIEIFSEVLSLAENPAIVEPSNGIPQSTNPPHDTASIAFKWNTTCAHVKEQPYQLVLKITDRPSAGPRLVRFKTVQIRVLAPPPEIKTVSINPITRQVVLTWDDYPCENVESFQVWRRVSEYEYQQPECNNGMPYFLRYQLLTELPADVSVYTDNDLAIGAQYCYRIVARTGSNNNPGKISLDTCIIPKPAEAPVITHVTVNQTNPSGEILVRWTSPFDIDPIQYPPPYHYKVYRAAGLSENSAFELLTQTPSADTIFVDVGANTQELPYQYKVELYVPSLTSLPVDTSSIASTVRLKTASLPTSISLTWDANTPWYNYAQKFPYHLIYRSENMNNNFVLIDSVDVNEKGFNYIDMGKFQNRNLSQGTDYYYKVLTRGTYGNPRIQQPLENFSQIMPGALLDTIPPCVPIVALEEIDCRSFSCTGSGYFNIITWTVPDGDCGDDVAAYKIYVRDETNTDFIPLLTSGGNTYKHSGLNSRAKCYKVASIDYSGNESAMSNVVCSDNCPYFELPNIITPGNKDELNDFLAAFTATTSDTTKCARFVVNIDVKIYDRWGGEVFSKNSITPEGNYILWNGLTNTGREVSSGVYFYSANVQFDMLDPHLQFKKFTGWVHVVR